VGRNEGIQVEFVDEASGAAEAVDVGETSSSSVPVGLALTGRSGWSVGLDMRLVEAPVGREVTEVVVPEMVVVVWMSA
jgi:hypothetical protein